MARRVSLQGKGVELFFGGSTGAEAAPTPPSADPGAGAAEEEATMGVRERVHARTEEAYGASDEQLFRGLGDKQRLASSTFRFRPEELDRLDLVFDELNRVKPKRVSKNDVVRLGLRWLLADYEFNRADSLLSRLLARA